MPAWWVIAHRLPYQNIGISPKQTTDRIWKKAGSDNSELALVEAKIKQDQAATCTPSLLEIVNGGRTRSRGGGYSCTETGIGRPVFGVFARIDDIGDVGTLPGCWMLMNRVSPFGVSQSFASTKERFGMSVVGNLPYFTNHRQMTG
jgi:hypothetical protein